MRPLIHASLGLVVASAALVGSSPASAQWAVDGVNVCAAPWTQVTPQTMADGSGGAFILWTDSRSGIGSPSGNRDIYAQRLAASGAVVHPWPVDGIKICDATGDQNNPVMASDGGDGLFIAWQDGRSVDNDLYLSHILGDGTLAPIWPVNGRLYGATTGNQQSPCLVADKAGGVFLVWSDSRDGNFDIRALHLDPDGISYTVAGTAGTAGFLGPQAPLLGFLICGATGDQTLPQAIDGGSNSAIVVWQDTRGANTDIYGARILDTGMADPDWTADGVLLSDATAGTDVKPRLVSDDTKGAIVGWFGSDQQIVRAQHLTNPGTIAWGPGGIITGASGSNFNVAIARDGLGGAFLGGFDPNGLYVQHISVEGGIAAGWPAVGLKITPASVGIPQAMLDDGTGGVYFEFWVGTRDLYAQHITGAGAVVVGWPAQGQMIRGVTAFDGRTGTGTMASDGAGGFMTAWEDQRPGVDTNGRSRDDIFAQRVLPMGLTAMYIGTLDAVGDVPADQGGWVALGVSAAPADVEGILPGVTGYNVWRLVSGPQPAPQDAMEAAPGDARALIERSRHEPVLLRSAQAAVAGFPAGTWQSLGFNAATQSATYSLLEPTRNDSTAAGPASETYLVTIHTPSPGQYFVTGPVSGRSTDNLPPAVPQNLAGTFVGGGAVNLAWNANTESDLNGYTVYRGSGAGFVPGPANRLGTPAAPAFHDAGFAPGLYYKVAALDRHGNESGYAVLAPGQVAEAPDAVTTVNFLAPLAPNPFSKWATVSFGMARAGHANVTVHDLAGRLVRTLLDGERTAGSYRLRWDGGDAAGRPLSPGIYFVRLRIPGAEMVERVVRVE